MLLGFSKKAHSFNIQGAPFVFVEQPTAIKKDGLLYLTIALNPSANEDFLKFLVENDLFYRYCQDGDWLCISGDPYTVYQRLFGFLMGWVAGGGSGSWGGFDFGFIERIRSSQMRKILRDLSLIEPDSRTVEALANLDHLKTISLWGGAILGTLAVGGVCWGLLARHKAPELRNCVVDYSQKMFTLRVRLSNPLSSKDPMGPVLLCFS